MSQFGAEHWRWKEGRTLLSSGYIGVRVAEGHHLRQGHGYAYEHQLVAEQIIGRELKKGEIVHHRNGIKADNRQENLEVVSSIAEHKINHRKYGSNLRKPGQDNELIKCACGCGGELKHFDESGRPRKYLGGHWRKGRKGGWK